jgi:hypothetical protein
MRFGEIKRRNMRDFRGSIQEDALLGVRIKKKVKVVIGIRPVNEVKKSRGTPDVRNVLKVNTKKWVG